MPAATMGSARNHQPRPATVKDTRPYDVARRHHPRSGEASASPLVVNEPLSCTLTTRWVKIALCPGGRKDTSSPGWTAPSSGCTATSEPTQTVGHMEGVVIAIRRPPERYQPNSASAAQNNRYAEQRGEGADARALDPGVAGHLQLHRGAGVDEVGRPAGADMPKSSPGNRWSPATPGGEAEVRAKVTVSWADAAVVGAATAPSRPATRGGWSGEEPGMSRGRREDAARRAALTPRRWPRPAGTAGWCPHPTPRPRRYRPGPLNRPSPSSRPGGVGAERALVGRGRHGPGQVRELGGGGGRGRERDQGQAAREEGLGRPVPPRRGASGPQPIAGYHPDSPARPR